MIASDDNGQDTDDPLSGSPKQGYSMPTHFFPFPSSDPSPQPSLRNQTKRRQVKNACQPCQRSAKRCTDVKPCLRCVKYGIVEECIDSARKERKKGVKRGPYKKRDVKGSSSREQQEQPRILDAQLSTISYDSFKQSSMLPPPRSIIMGPVVGHYPGLYPPALPVLQPLPPLSTSDPKPSDQVSSYYPPYFFAPISHTLPVPDARSTQYHSQSISSSNGYSPPYMMRATPQSTIAHTPSAASNHYNEGSSSRPPYTAQR